MYTLQAHTDTRSTDVHVLRTLLLAATGWVLLYGASSSTWFRYPAAGVLLLLAWFCRFLQMRPSITYSRLVILSALLLLLSTRNPIHAILFAAFALLPRLFYGSGKIGIDENGVSLPYYGRTRRHAWSELQHLVLKDGLLSIDFRNNRLIQLLIETGKTPVDEKSFNEFCRNQLETSLTSEKSFAG